MGTNYGRSIVRAQYPIRTKGQSKCPDHRENDLVLLCQDCKTLICTTCSITSHKSHIDSFREITKIAKQQRDELQDFIKDTDEVKIPKLKEDITTARQEISTYQPKYELISENVIKHCNKCKLELDKLAEDYLSICSKMEEATTDLLQNRIKNLEDRLDTLVKLSSEGKQTLQTGTAVLVYDSVSEIQDMDFDSPQTPNIDMTKFILSNDIQGHLEQAMGQIKPPIDLFQGPVAYKLLDSPTVISEFSYTGPISAICPAPDERVWLCHCFNNTANLVNNKGQVIQKIKHRSNIQHISLDPTTGRLWFCCVHDGTIYEVSTSSTPVRRFTTEGYPQSLCVTREGRVVVGLSGIVGSKVVMYTADGQVLHTANASRSGNGPVCSITECVLTGNIAIVSSKMIGGDSSNPDTFKCHIIVYNPALQPLFHYRGEGIQTQEEVHEASDKFDPRVVVYDSKGNIVTIDWVRNTIGLISGTGKYIKTLHTIKGRLGTVGIQKDDVLWSYFLLGNGSKRGLKLLKYYND